jgi:CheY-like chemotaxis protein
MNIMLVEDDLIIAHLFRRMLQQLGHAVCVHVTRGEDALAAYVEHRPGLVFMDIRLAGAMNGIEAAEAIIGADPGARIAFMSAYGTNEVRTLTQSVPHVGFLEKPVPAARLEELLLVVSGMRP